MEWHELGRGARAYRVVHIVWSIAGLGSLAYIWFAALTRRRDRRLAASVGFLLVEGAGLVIGGGDCPLGPFQAKLGDPVPLFELVLPPRGAKAAVPALALATILAMAAVAARGPQKRDGAATRLGASDAG